MTTCKNCGHQFEGYYCNNCGQKSATGKINLAFLISEIRDGLLQFDSGFFYTAKELFTRPGATIREYIEGKRVQHYKPIVFVIILSTFYGILAYYLQTNTYLNDFIEGFENGFDDPKNKEEQTPSILIWLTSNYQYSSLIFLPFISLASYLAFYKKPYNYFEHFVLNAFLTGQRSLVYILFLFIRYGWPGVDVFDYVAIGGAIVLNFWAYMSFFEGRKRWVIFLQVLLYFFYLVAILILIFFAWMSIFYR